MLRTFGPSRDSNVTDDSSAVSSIIARSSSAILALEGSRSNESPRNQSTLDTTAIREGRGKHETRGPITEEIDRLSSRNAHRSSIAIKEAARVTMKRTS